MPTFVGKQIELKIVYYGPAKCGKTTNLQEIHRMIKPDHRGKLMSMANVKDDRTIFFDLLPIKVPLPQGRFLSSKLFTVPGQVAYQSTRRLVLQNVDGVVFVADSQRSEAEANRQSFLDLTTNLQQLRLDPKTIPLVVQFNKRDLPDVRPMAELEAAWKARGVPVCAASAVRGEGVMETLQEILRVTFQDLVTKLPALSRDGLTADGFLERVMRNFARSGDETELSAAGSDPRGTPSGAAML